MTIYRWALASAVLALPLLGHAESVTYDFTGVVDGLTADITGTSIGSVISGTLTFDYSNALESTGTIGSSTGFLEQRATGSFYDLPTSNLYVFSLTLSSGAYSFATGAPGAESNVSLATGQSNGGAFEGQNRQMAGDGSVSFSEFDIAISPPGHAYDLNGLPVLSAGSYAYGNVYVEPRNQPQSGLDFVVTSIAPAPVPLPASVWQLMSGTLGLVFLFNRRSGIRVRTSRTAAA